MGILFGWVQASAIFGCVVETGDCPRMVLLLAISNVLFVCFMVVLIVLSYYANKWF